MNTGFTQPLSGRTLWFLAAVTFPCLPLGGAEMEPSWPRTIELPKARIVVYQPQLETFEADRIKARAAVAVQAAENEEQAPIFGVVWFTARVSTDRVERMVTLLEPAVSDIRFPQGSEKSVETIRKLIEKQFPEWNHEVSLDRILTALELAEREQSASEDLQADPPRILFRTHPAVLVLLDGEPRLQPVGDSGVMRVINTPAFIVLDPGTKAYYLYGGGAWLKAGDLLEGAWSLEPRPPATVTNAAEGEQATAKEQDRGDLSQEQPEIIVTTEPTELIVLDGEPEYSSVSGTALLYVSDTESDVFLDVGSQQYWVVLSGRWYRGASLDGPWSHVDPGQLPEDFAKIPPGSPKGHVLASVPGTEEAREAILDAQLPQTAQVKRDEATLDVRYDGEPEFQPIESTTMACAVNTPESVFRVGDKYYCCSDGVWFEASSATGPWVVSVSVPAEIATIPPSCPHYHVRYVHVYDYTPTVVYVGYTPGYLGCYVVRGCVWYGTGWRYRGWYRRRYYPRPVTYGLGVRYNPYTGGWRVRAGVRGPYLGVGAGRGPAGGTWVGVGVGGRVGWWERGYGRGAAGIYRNRDIHLDNNIYSRRTDVVRTWNQRPADRPGAARPAAREAAAARPGTAARPATREARPTTTQPRPRIENNVFADRDGNIYRRGADGGWEKRTKQGWTRTTTPGTPATGVTRPARPAQPITRPSRPGTPAAQPRSLDRAAQARSRGTYRTQRYSHYRSAPTRSRTTTRPAARPSAPRRPMPIRGGGGLRRR